MNNVKTTNSKPWPPIPFEDCLAPLKIRKPRKILARDYANDGNIPIVDQGKELIAGWTNDESAGIRDHLPLIVFGDHTRIFKFGDFPFALGADGTQLLKPGKDFNPHFFYYACLDLPLPNRGYNRHFGILKEQELPKPSKPEQEKIAAVLCNIQRAIETEDKLTTTARELKQSAMRQLFTHGLRGDPQKDTEIGPIPESWQPTLIRGFGNVVTGTTPKTSERKFYEGGSFHFIAPGDIGRTTKIYRSAKVLTEAGLEVSRVLPKNSVCFVCIGSSIGKIGVTTQERSTTNQQINAIVVNEQFDPFFVCYLLSQFSDYVSSFTSPSPVPIMSKGTFEQVLLYAPMDKTEQVEIAQIISAIDDQIEIHERRCTILQELFKTMLHQLMTGEIRVADLDIEVSEIKS